MNIWNRCIVSLLASIHASANKDLYQYSEPLRLCSTATKTCWLFTEVIPRKIANHIVLINYYKILVLLIYKFMITTKITQIEEDLSDPKQGSISTFSWGLNHEITKSTNLPRVKFFLYVCLKLYPNQKLAGWLFCLCALQGWNLLSYSMILDKTQTPDVWPITTSTSVIQQQRIWLNKQRKRHVTLSRVTGLVNINKRFWAWNLPENAKWFHYTLLWEPSSYISLCLSSSRAFVAFSCCCNWKTQEKM